MRSFGADAANPLGERIYPSRPAASDSLEDETDGDEHDATRGSIIDTIFDLTIRACDLVTLASTLGRRCDSTDDDIEIISRASVIAHAMADAMAAEKSGEDGGALASTPNPLAPAVDAPADPTTQPVPATPQSSSEKMRALKERIRQREAAAKPQHDVACVGLSLGGNSSSSSSSSSGSSSSNAAALERGGQKFRRLVTSSSCCNGSPPRALERPARQTTDDEAKWTVRNPEGPKHGESCSAQQSGARGAEASHYGSKYDYERPPPLLLTRVLPHRKRQHTTL